MPPTSASPDHAGSESASELERHVTPATVPVRRLEVRESFEGLTDEEKRYAHWMSVAAWRGALITFEQSTAEAPRILELLLSIFALPRTSLRRAASRRGVDDERWNDLLVYAARFLSNAGNHLGFGDTKFVPRCPPETLDRVVAASTEIEPRHSDRWWSLWQSLREPIYRLEPDDLRLGLPPEGRSRYYGAGITRDDATRASAFMRQRGLEAWNTRLDRHPVSGELEIHIAAIRELEEGPFEAEGDRIRIVRGDHASRLRRVAAALVEAGKHAANDHQRDMIAAYVDHFESGAIDDHKAAMRHWVRDLSPVVEANLGFIETYRDPLHVRAEWEGFVAIRNAEQTAALQQLVDRAKSLMRHLPWPEAFERETFIRPDFTSLEVLSFAGSGIPAGINIPNYSEVRDQDGFKNVSLGNVLRSARQDDGPISFLRPEDQELYRHLAAPAFQVQVGLHELLGHGTGKLLSETAEGELNFDPALVNPLTQRRVETWYAPGESWGSRFGGIAAPFEECRAEAVGLCLSLQSEALEVFGHEGKAAEDVAYCNWLHMARAGVLALRFFDPETESWGQAHMRARFALLRVMLAAGRDLLRIEQHGDAWVIELERALVPTAGVEAVADFLLRLHVYRCTADAAGGTAFFESWSRPEAWMLPLRDAVIAKEKPRHVWVQAVTDLDDHGDVVLREYPATFEGVIDSFVDRFTGLAGLVHEPNQG